MKTGNSKGLGEVLKTLKRPTNSDRTQQQPDQAAAAATNPNQKAVNVNISAQASAQNTQGSERAAKVAAFKAEFQETGSIEFDNREVAKSLINELGIGNGPVV